jgi:two-component system sensor histidine kinase/response regulator
MQTTPPDSQTPNSCRVLLVDDKPENLKLLAEMLSEEYTIQVALSGARALRAVDEQAPDIILLDVNMPGTDGFEVCRALRDNPETCEIPVIFVTALAKTDEIVRGLNLGAVDYITKPFQTEELIARMETHLELRRLRSQLDVKIADLEDKNERLDLFAKALAHDLRNPITSALGFSEIIVATQNLDVDTRECAGIVNTGVRRIHEIVESLLLLSTCEDNSQHLSAVEMMQPLDAAIRALAPKIESSGAKIHRPSDLPSAIGNAVWIQRLWTNYLSNAIKYGGSIPEIHLGADDLGTGMIRFWVDDNGAGLLAKQKEELFTPFTRLHPDKAKGIGLGLVIVSKITEQMSGETGVLDSKSGGCRFYFCLPAPDPDPVIKNSAGQLQTDHEPILRF